jgi:hypothetical protein
MAEIRTLTKPVDTPADAVDETPVSRDEAAMVAYLKAHPDFLANHPQLLEAMELRHASGAAVSLIERQVEILRGRNARLQDKLQHLIDTARENETRAASVQRLARTLIRAPTLAAVVVGLGQCMRDDFAVDHVFVGVHGSVLKRYDIEGLHRLDAQGPIAKACDDFFRTRLIECGPIEEARAALFFPKAKEPLRSAALVPLEKEKNLGILVLASREPDRFQPRQGKLFLEMTADLMSAAIRARLG